MVDTAESVVTEVDALVKDWDKRKASYQGWYRLIQLHNDLKQDKMESVISTDPRSAFNMAKWLLTPRTSRFEMDTSDMDDEQIDMSALLQSYANTQLRRANQRSRTFLWGRFQNRLISLMLATGWYSIISFPTPQGWVMDVWNPAQVYPDYGSNGGLVRLARKYSTSAVEANAKIRLAGWSPPTKPYEQKVTFYTLWRVGPEGVTHTVVAQSGSKKLVKPTTPTIFHSIPIVTGPAGGLPDDGSIMGNDDWKKEIGQAIVASVMDIQKNYNKSLTYLQQLIRDTANPRWVEEVHGESVLDPDKLYMRGAVFTISPGERIYPIATPPLPPEIRSHLFDLRSNLQRSTFSDVAFGNAQGQISGFLMSQVTASSKQILSPYHDALQDSLGHTATSNIHLMRELGYKVDGVDYDKLPEDLFMEWKYSIDIPGDFINRASSAKVLNPDFRLSASTLIDVLFPEVESALLEQASLTAEDAANNPIVKQILLVSELERSARIAERDEDFDLSQSLRRWAARIEAGSEAPDGTQDAVVGGVPPNAMPPAVQEVLGVGGG